MPSVQTVHPLEHFDLPGVTIFAMSSPVVSGDKQQVLVVVDPLAEIPLHCHSVDAEMFIVAGRGIVLSNDQTDGRLVKAGDQVVFERNAAHGFRAGDKGLSFVSTNGGIVDTNPDCWDIDLL